MLHAAATVRSFQEYLLKCEPDDEGYVNSDLCGNGCLTTSDNDSVKITNVEASDDFTIREIDQESVQEHMAKDEDNCGSNSSDISCSENSLVQEHMVKDEDNCGSISSDISCSEDSTNTVEVNAIPFRKNVLNRVNSNLETVAEEISLSFSDEDSEFVGSAPCEDHLPRHESQDPDIKSLDRSNSICSCLSDEGEKVPIIDLIESPFSDLNSQEELAWKRLISSSEETLVADDLPESLICRSLSEIKDLSDCGSVSGENLNNEDTGRSQEECSKPEHSSCEVSEDTVESSNRSRVDLPESDTPHTSIVEGKCVPPKLFFLCPLLFLSFGCDSGYLYSCQAIRDLHVVIILHSCEN